MAEISGAGLTGGVRSNLAGEGFKVADGYVDVHAEPDRDSARRAAFVITDVVGDESERVGRSRATTFFAAMFTPNASVLQALRTGIPAVLSSPIGVAALTLGGLFAVSFISAVVSAFALGGLGGAFLALGAFALRENEKIKTAFDETVASISEGMATAAAPLIPAFMGAFAIINNVFTNQVMPLLLQIFTGLAPVIEPLVTAVGDAIVTFLTAVGDPAVLNPLRDFFITIAPLIPQIAEALADFFIILADNADLIAAAFRITIDIISRLIVVAASVLVFFSGMLIALKMGWDGLWAAIRTGAANAANFARSVWRFTVNFISALIEGFGRVVSNVRDRIRGIWSALKENIINPIRDGITSAVEFVKGLPGRILSAVGDLGSLLYNAGRDILQGLINGVRDMFGSLGDVLSDAAGLIPDWFPGSPVKRGPLMVLNQMSTNPGAKTAKLLMEGFNTQMQAFTPALAGVGVGNVTVRPSIANPPVSVRVLLDGREIAPTVYAVADERDLQIKRAVTSGGSRLP